MYTVDTSVSNHVVHYRMAVTLSMISETITCRVVGVKVVQTVACSSFSFGYPKD